MQLKSASMKPSGLYLGLAVAASALTNLSGSSQANAAVYTTDFSTIGVQYYFTGPYSDGGITVEYVGAGPIWTTGKPTAPSGYSWYPNGGGTGYTDITLTGGGAFTSVQLLVGSGWFPGVGQLDYQLLNGANVVSTGDWGTLPEFDKGFVTASFSGGPFTELRIQAPLASTFSPSNFETLAVGSITLSTGVPELSTWSMMLIGFAGLGFAGFRASRKNAVSAV
jgi:hypothetical protein